MSLFQRHVGKLALLLICHTVIRVRETCPSHPLPPVAGRRGGSKVIKMIEQALHATALRGAGPAPHLGSVAELALDVEVAVNRAQGHECGKVTRDS